ncbi:OmpA family protein [Hyphomicrobium sp.]|uniref:OmpA family protein n=1 Tax=Hyphomicrobium sp. TaxID=82 RepID=UPI00356373F7
MAEVFDWDPYDDAAVPSKDSVASAPKPPAAAKPSSAQSFLAEPSSPTDRNSGVGADTRAGSDQADKAKSEGNVLSASNGVKLDLAEISTTGEASVFVGRAAPGASVTVMENGIAVASTTANSIGDWSLVTEHKFAGPDPKFNLIAGLPKAPGETPNDGGKALADSAKTSAESAKTSEPISGTEKPPTSPSVALLKNFESVVAAARKDASAQDRPESSVAAAEATPPLAPSVGGPTSEARAPSPSPSNAAGSERARSATIPVPMTFVFDQVTLTPDGEKTAKLLLDYVLLKKFKSISLTGHADERGTAEYNMDLSRKRLDTVAEFLRRGGYHGEMQLVPEGATQPFTGIDRSKVSRDDLMQLDRRVELRNAV